MTLAIPPRPATPIVDDLDAHFATIPVDRTPAKAGAQPAADNPTISHEPTALETWLWALAFAAVIGTTWWLKSAAESGAL